MLPRAWHASVFGNTGVPRCAAHGGDLLLDIGLEPGCQDLWVKAVPASKQLGDFSLHFADARDFVRGQIGYTSL